MTRLAITGLAGIATGRIEAPTSGVDAITIDDGRITGFEALPDPAESIDARGGWLVPGLWDGRFRLYFGDHEPVLSARGAMSRSVEFGVTTVVGSGAPKVHGWSRAPRPDRELAILTTRSWRFDRPRGIGVIADVATANDAWGAADLAALRDAGTRYLAVDARDAEALGALPSLARDHGLALGVVLTDGRASAPAGPGLLSLDPAFVILETGHERAADLAAELLDLGVRAIGITLTAGPTALLAIVRHARSIGRLDRVFLGTGLPGPSGVVPAGIGLMLETVVASGSLTAPEAIGLATGNVARAYGLDGGILEVGAVADLSIRAPGAALGPWARPTELTLIGGAVAWRRDAADSDAPGGAPG